MQSRLILSDETMTDLALLKLFSDAPPRGIILLEDVDAAFSEEGAAAVAAKRAEKDDKDMTPATAALEPLPLDTEN